MKWCATIIGAGKAYRGGEFDASEPIRFVETYAPYPDWLKKILIEKLRAKLYC
ncbi:MAG: hypothetical protein LBT45_01805 [Rickettsiales bacterium]|jgi:hypothetical protein|nr:hypothetical protein [Rickettsiales bacterium]